MVGQVSVLARTADSPMGGSEFHLKQNEGIVKFPWLGDSLCKIVLTSAPY